MITLRDIEAALRCALPVLPADPGARHPIATACALVAGGRSFVAAPASIERPRVPGSNTAREELALEPLRAGLHRSLAAAPGAVDLELHGIPRISPGAKLALRGFPSFHARLDNDDGTMRWRSLTLTARATTETQLKLDEPDAIADFEGLLGAPVFALLEEGPRFAGVLVEGEKRSVLGLGTLLPAAALLELIRS
jgi:hypothetical protein